jgi:hypothetical protein
MEMSIKDNIKGIQEILQSKDLKRFITPKRMRLIITPISIIIPFK